MIQVDRFVRVVGFVRIGCFVLFSFSFSQSLKHTVLADHYSFGIERILEGARTKRPSNGIKQLFCDAPQGTHVRPPFPEAV